MTKLVYRKRDVSKGLKGGYVEMPDLKDGDELTEIEALIVTLKDIDLTLEMISQSIDGK